MIGVHEWLASQPKPVRQRIVETLDQEELNQWNYHWEAQARPSQLPPDGDWRTWLILAGRGFGKTRAGAEWVRMIAERDGDARIALISSSLTEARSVMVEGESGLLACSPDGHKPVFEASLRRVKFPNGAQVQLFSAAEPESLRGPQFSHAWCDEVGKWSLSHDRATRTWDNLLLCLRLGDDPRITVTTTPRAVPLVQRLLDQQADGSLIVTHGSTYDNAANLSDSFLHTIDAEFGGSQLGRQEINGEMLTDLEGSLWKRTILEQAREQSSGNALCRVVVAVDPPISSSGDECGIIAEANQGGAMVESVLRAANNALPIKLVHASRGKVARAEPIAALYEAGKVRHCGAFPKLEDQMCGMMIGGEYAGPGRSPDRADALVWALSELMLGRMANPSVRSI